MRNEKRREHKYRGERETLLEENYYRETAFVAQCTINLHKQIEIGLTQNNKRIMNMLAKRLRLIMIPSIPQYN